MHIKLLKCIIIQQKLFQLGGTEISQVVLGDIEDKKWIDIDKMCEYATYGSVIDIIALNIKLFYLAIVLYLFIIHHLCE